MYRRDAQSLLLEASKQFRAVAVVGPRQSGKTTLCKNTFPEKAYVSLENQDELNFALSDPRGFLDRFGTQGAIIDEAQKVPVLFSYLQGILDHSNIPGQFILTGSNHFLLQENISQSLAGRIYYLRLLPLSHAELQHNLLEKENLFSNIWYGGYPELFEKNIDPQKWYPNYTNTYIERDVRQIKSIQNLGTFSRMMQLLAARCGQLLNMSALANELDTDAKTVSHWISVLQSSFVVFLLQSYYENFNKRVTKTPKIYFYDTGFLCSLLQIKTPELLDIHPFKGNIYENYVMLEFIKNNENFGKNLHFYFWNESNGNEVDIVIPGTNQMQTFEIKTSKTYKPEFATQLHKLETYSKRENLKTIIYNGEMEFKHDLNLRLVNFSKTLVPELAKG